MADIVPVNISGNGSSASGNGAGPCQAGARNGCSDRTSFWAGPAVRVSDRPKHARGAPLLDWRLRSESVLEAAGLKCHTAPLEELLGQLSDCRIVDGPDVRRVHSRSSMGRFTRCLKANNQLRIA
jgi:hypothetical protein